MLETINAVVSSICDFFYTYLLIILLIAGGLIFTLLTRFAPFRLYKEQLKAVLEKPKDKNGVSSFQALMVSTASRVGTGNIIGVATALCVGGFGSVFWMWVIAIIGSASAFIESTLAQIYKKRGPEGSYGGPAYYIETGLRCKPLAIVFSVLLILTYGVGFNMLASFNLQSTFETYEFYNATYTPLVIGLIVAGVVCYCLMGGGKRIEKISSLLVPVIGLVYIAVSFFIIVMNIGLLPDVFVKIFTQAFDFEAIFGGFTGSCVMHGIKRGLFSNEAGVGSAPNASASADVAHPVKQGLVQVLSVFIDTILVCSATAFMCMCSGVEPSEKMKAAEYVQLSLKTTLGDFGPIFITVAMVLFAFTTLLGNIYYVDKGIAHVIGHVPSKKYMIFVHIVFSLYILCGSMLNADLLWDVSDVLMGGMVIINIPVILILSRYAIRALKDYEKQRKEGKEPVFHAKNINLPHKVDYWE